MHNVCDYTGENTAYRILMYTDKCNTKNNGLSDVMNLG